MIGGAPISTGLYVSPHNLSDLFPDSVKPYLVTATAQDLNIRGLTDPHAIAEELWPAQHVIDLYHVLTDALEADNPAEQPFVRQLKLADALERVLRIDPLIPLELRTQPWPPSEIRKQWIRTWHTTLTGAEDTHVFAGWITEN
ncbi:PaaX family transcriptional regulator C-terminal domain-containing protein [Timonella sp. A28]|uniref:PaaX family transcriptional regulator C-terminal domain-containing protein n=1 Tax=Timonella sp. A28 TaxID=3442640 RepID=UPI003EBE3BCF